MATGIRALPLLLIAGGLLAAPVAAQQDRFAELDRLADEARDPGTGIALARRQLAAGELTGATATLERVLLAHPESDAALLMHVTLLCRLDDKEGAKIEFAELGGIGISDSAWEDVTDACGAMPHPTRRR